MSKREFLQEQGYLTFAIGKEYLRLAYAQALSIKLTQKINNFAVVVDKQAASELVNLQPVFDKVIEIDYNAHGWDMTQHYRAYGLTPWRETILLDADIIFTESVDHWWPALRTKDVCLTKSVSNFREQRITSRNHRKLFDQNLLPDTYAGFVYFRYTYFAMEFFSLIKLLTENWNWIAKEHLKFNEDNRVRLDELFSIATRIVGIQNVTLPISYPNFTHGKEELWNLSVQQPWYEQLFVEWNSYKPIIGHYPQRLPLHYHHKEWMTDDIIEQYERYYKELN